jgi:hypothetical protein
VETKSYRKTAPRDEVKDYVVTFDGRNLTWPWGEDNRGLEQAERNSVWLSDWLKSETSERVHVAPYLAVPGWYVRRLPARDSRLARVVKPEWLPEDFGKLGRILPDDRIKTIGDALERRCRTIEF